MPLLDIDIEMCAECGGAIKVIACIDDPVVIKKILAHRTEKAASATKGLLPARPGTAASRLVRLTGLNETNHPAQVAAPQHSGRASIGLGARRG